MICSNKFFLYLLSLFAGVQLFAAPPVPFSGKLAVDGTNFHGHALFSFSIVDGGDYGYVTLNNSFSASDLAIICFTSSGTTAHEYSINGNLEASSISLSTNSFNDAPPSIGSAFESGAETLTGFICEIILFSSASSTSEMKMIEGYLAHKWNLADKLPSDHPYKNSAP